MDNKFNRAQTYVQQQTHIIIFTLLISSHLPCFNLRVTRGEREECVTLEHAMRITPDALPQQLITNLTDQVLEVSRLCAQPQSLADG